MIYTMYSTCDSLFGSRTSFWPKYFTGNLITDSAGFTNYQNNKRHMNYILALILYWQCCTSSESDKPTAAARRRGRCRVRGSCDGSGGGSRVDPVLDIGKF